MSDNIDDIVKDFVIDSYENLDRIDRELVLLEQNPDALDIITRIFRSVHTIKGVCGFLSYAKLREVCHSGESLLSCLRDGRLRLSPDIASALLGMVDAIRQILGVIESTRAEGAADYTALIAQMDQITETAPKKKAPEPRSKKPRGTEPELGPATAGAPIELPPSAPATGPSPVAEPLTAGEGDPPPKGASAAPVVLGAAPVVQPALPSGAVWDRGIRVDIELLDRLMTLVGELVLARNQILQFNAAQNGVFASAAQRLDAITTELQEGVMKTRMQPIGVIWSRFPRLVRDLAVGLGKEIRVEMDGMDTELDKTLIEAIKDPLTHLVRNAVDHGIEFPGARAARGKPREGHLHLSAFHEGGFVNIEIADDGNGIDFERVRQKAVQNGLVSAEQAARLSFKEAINLLFLPGFSTAEKITDLSGRGVGMDVVKTNIERIGGTIDIDTKPGNGTRMVVKVPLTLAIIPALMVTCDGDRYAIPQSSLLELVRLDEHSQARIEMIHGTPVYRLRDRLLPLVSLRQRLGIEHDLQREVTLNIVVLHASGRQFGLLVDGVRDTEEIVVKPLGKQLQGLGCYAGATILGDGKVALILEVLGLAQEANVLSKAQDTSTATEEALDRPTEVTTQSVLLFASGGGQMAVALNKVTRLEAFPRTVMEQLGGQDVVQYRGDIMRLVHLEHALPGYRADTSGSELLHVVVYSHGGRSMGVVIGTIMDIVDAPVVLQRAGERMGVLGSSVVHGKVTEFLDLQGVVLGADPSFGEGAVARHHV